MIKAALHSISSSGKDFLRTDLLIGVLVMAIVALMILPVPIVLLDSLLALNLSLAILLLMAALFAHHTLDLSTFPSMLLFTTLLRLGLNIASTKSILLHADAGHLITSFGELVVAGNLVVGLVVFTIITVVQFVVITKGSERVAEVGARFTLDAMPGKQMAIDADLRAGHLSASDAQRRRAQLTIESQLHGGMDGAMKFVKGDAIAGLVITVINLLGGMVVGVMYHAMSASEAASRFAILSIGDAMVSSLPSLFISVAAGVLITRVDSQRSEGTDTLGTTIIRQLTTTPSALAMAALAAFAMSIIPGFPHLQFLVLAAGLAWLTHQAHTLGTDAQTEKATHPGAVGSSRTAVRLASSPGSLTSALSVRIGALAGPHLNLQGLQAAWTEQQRRLQADLGLISPQLQIWLDEHWPQHAFEIQIQEVPVMTVEMPPGHVWLSSTAHPLWSSATLPSTPMPMMNVRWLAATSAQHLASERTPEQLVAALCHHMLRQHADRFMGIQELMGLMDSVGREYPGLVAEVQKILPVQRQAEVFKRLLEEGVPIRNLRGILESLITWGHAEKDINLLTEYVRQGLGSWLAHHACAGTGAVRAVLLDVGTEQLFRQHIKPTPAGTYLAMPPEVGQWFEVQLASALETETSAPLIVSMDIRRGVRRLVQLRWPQLAVYSYQELEGHAEIQTIAVIRAEGAPHV